MNNALALPLVISLLLVPALARSQIMVSGSAEIKVKPDEVQLTVGVETRHESLDEAKKQNDKRVADALKFLRENEVEEKNIQTDFVIVEPVYDSSAFVDPTTGLPRPGHEKQLLGTEPAYYQVRKTIGIKVTNPAHFEAILSGLITNGVNHVRRIDFRTSELRKYKDRARAMALQAAKEKAQAAASSLGVKLGKPSNISINDSGGWVGWWPQSGWGYGGGGLGGAGQNVSQNLGGENGEAGSTFAVGQISVSANVSVSFLLK